MAAATPLVCKGHSAEVTDISYSAVTADGSFFVTSSRDGNSYLRKGETGDWVGTFSGHNGAVWTCQIDPTATRLLTASADYTARVWDCVRGEEVREMCHGQVVRGAVLIPETNQMATLAYKKFRMWDLRVTDAISEVVLEKDVNQLIICHEETQFVYTADATNTLSLMSLQTGEEVQRCQVAVPPCQLSLSSDGMLLLAAHEKGVTALCEYSLDLMKEFRMEGGAKAAALHPSKECLMTSHPDSSLRLTEFDTEQLIRVYAGPAPASPIRYSPDGEVLAGGTGQEVLLWPQSPGKRYGLWKERNYNSSHINNPSNRKSQ